jgi:hypothetical protein
MPTAFSRNPLLDGVFPILDIDAVFICSTINYLNHTFVVQMGMVKLSIVGSGRKEVYTGYN